MDAMNFVLGMEDRLSGPTSAASNALGRLENQIQREQAALAALEGKLDSARGKLAALAASGEKTPPGFLKQMQDGVDGLANKVGAKKDRLGALFERRDKLGEKKKGAADEDKLIGKKKAIKDVLGGELGNLASAASDAGGPLGQLAGGLQKVGSILGKAGPVGAVIALAAALLAVAAAAVIAFVALTHFALGAADAARSARLMNDAAAGSAKAGAELSMVIDDVANKTPLAKTKIAEMGRALELAHLSGRRMQNALEAMAVVASAVGEGAAGKIEEIAKASQKARRFLLKKEDLEGTGVAFAEVAAALAQSMGVSLAQATAMLKSGAVSVDKGLDALNKAVQKKFGKTIQGQMMALSTQFAKLKENLAGLFEGINLEEFLAGLKMVTDLFSQNTVTGRALKAMFTQLFSGLFKWLGSLLPFVAMFFKGFVIGALTVYIALVKLKKFFVDVFGGGKSSVDGMAVALWAGKIALYVLIAGAIVLTGVLLLLGAIVAASAGVMLIAFLAIMAPLIAIAAGVALVILYFDDMSDSVNEALDMDLGEAGNNLINSFIDAIWGSIGSVIGAMAALGGAAKDALFGALGIHSPSKVALEAATNVTTTFSEGVDDGAGDMKGSMDGLAKAPGGKGGKGGGRPIEFNNCNFIGTTIDTVRSMIHEVLEAESGAGPSPEPAPA